MPASYPAQPRQAPIRFGALWVAWKWRVSVPNPWLGIGVLACSVFYATSMVSDAVLAAITRAVLHHDLANFRDMVFSLAYRLPILVAASALIWTVECGLYRVARKQQRRQPAQLQDLFAHLSLWPSLLLPAALANVAYALALGLALERLRWHELYWWIMALEPLFVGPFIFVLILMSDRGMSVRQATAESLRRTGRRAPAYSIFYWLATALAFALPAGILLCAMLCGSQVASWVWILLLLMSVWFAFPYLFIAVAQLYRDTCPDPDQAPSSPASSASP